MKLSVELGKLRLQNQRTQSFKYAKNSASNVLSAIRQYLYFTNYFKLLQVPASVDTITCFLEFMARSSGYDHIKHLYASVKYLHSALDQYFPEESFQIDTTLQGLKRRLANVPFQVLPLTPQILRKMYGHINPRSKEDLALWCSFLCAFYGLLRKANVVPKSGSYDPRKILVRRNIKVDHANNMVYLYIGFTKTNQFGSRDTIIPIPGNNDPAMDPVRHLSSLLSVTTGSMDTPAFAYGPGPSQFITYNKFTKRLKTLLSLAGYNPDSFSGHSFRRGGATFLHSCGGSTLMIQASGDWSSDCFTRYLYLTESQRLQAQALIARGISLNL